MDAVYAVGTYKKDYEEMLYLKGDFSESWEKPQNQRSAIWCYAARNMGWCRKAWVAKVIREGLLFSVPSKAEC